MIKSSTQLVYQIQHCTTMNMENVGSSSSLHDEIEEIESILSSLKEVLSL